MSEYQDLRFQIGARTLLSIRRNLVRVPFALADILAGTMPKLPPLARGAHGYLVTSLPEALMARVIRESGGLRPCVRQAYTRHYADLDQGYDSYLAGFSAKSRSTLLRKSRRLAERCGGSIDVRAYRTPAEIAEFHVIARDISSKTYQERLLDAGLPDDDESRAEIATLAGAGAVRGFILFIDGKPASYLFLPAEKGVLVYAFLGFDPAFGDLSPGAVLQLEAMRLLMEEGRFRRLDFTEGEGQHKRLFATGGAPCVDLLLMRASLANLACVGALQRFDQLVALGRRIGRQPLLRPLSNALRR